LTRPKERLREEVGALLFSVYDISETLTKIHLLLLGEEDDGEEEDSG
jgi:hypothetical protein